MSNWGELSTNERIAKLRALARGGMTEGQIEALLGAPDGSIRTIARRLHIVLQSDRNRKAAEADFYEAGAVRDMWSADEDRRRVMIAARASRGARKTLRALQ